MYFQDTYFSTPFVVVLSVRTFVFTERCDDVFSTAVPDALQL